MVILFERQLQDRVDLPGDLLLPVQRELHRLFGGGECALRRGHRGDDDCSAGVDEVLDEAHGVVALFCRLAGEMLGKPRQALDLKMGSDRDVLKRRTKLTANLRVKRVILLLPDNKWESSDYR